MARTNRRVIYSSWLLLGTVDFILGMGLGRRQSSHSARCDRQKLALDYRCLRVAYRNLIFLAADRVPCGQWAPDGVPRGVVWVPVGVVPAVVRAAVAAAHLIGPPDKASSGLDSGPDLISFRRGVAEA
jgi:hypothetical protein